MNLSPEDRPGPGERMARIIGRCYVAASLARELGWTQADVEAAAADLRLLALRTADGDVVYPAFQVHDVAIVPGLTEVLQALSAGSDDPWTWALWLQGTSSEERASASPCTSIELLIAGEVDRVLRNAQHSAAAWGGP
jgi:hypothetical protein